MSRKKRAYGSLPLHAGGELEAQERAELEAEIAADAELAEEARKYEQAYDDVQSVREGRPDFDEEIGDLWPDIRDRLFAEARTPAAGEPLVLERPRWHRRPLARMSGVAALLLVSFSIGLTMGDFGGMLRPATPDAESGGFAHTPETGTVPDTGLAGTTAPTSLAGGTSSSTLEFGAAGVFDATASQLPVYPVVDEDRLQTVETGVRHPGGARIFRVGYPVDF